MAGICDSIISKGIAVDCDNPIVKGLEADGIICNRADVDFSQCVFDSDNKNIIKSLVLKSSKKGYPVVQQGATPFSGAKTNLVVGTYRNTFTNEIPIAILDNSPEVAQNIVDGLANGSFVLLLRNVHKGAAGKSEYQIYGYYQGLRASAIDNEKYSEDTDGGWLVTLQETSVPKSALFFFDTDQKTTETKFKSLLGGAG
ncbi:MAG: hypothetical protein PUG96_02440 [Prevotellaceae bacterium]|nr:hypothetical protein [Prevotella sp.]MDD7272811.1 hypothetical protein [Prevotellaceae bacterium]